MSDSLETFDRRASSRETVRLKRELLVLVDEAGMTGMDGHGFFESLGRSDLEIEIDELDQQVRKLQNSLETLRDAIRFYEENIDMLSRSNENGGETKR